MSTTGIDAATAVDLVLGQTRGLRGYLTGSCAAAAARQHDGSQVHAHAYSDVDLFVGSENEWIRSIQFLVDHGYSFGPRMEMLWYRVLHYGTHGWHTNSMKLLSPEGIEVNLIFKTVARKPVNSLSQVLETFDFGLLAMGWETEDGTYRDARAYQFPGLDPAGPLPMLPWRREAFRQGHFREHQGMRTFGRAARYFDTYGYDGSLVLPDMVDGYLNASQYYLDRTAPEKIQLGQMYQKIGLLLDDRDWPALHAASDLLPKADSMDELYDFLIEP